MQVGGFLFYSAAPMATTSQDRKNKMKSEKAFSESTPIHALLKYGLDGGSENFESAVNAYVAWAKTRSVQSRLLLLQSFDRNVGKARRKRISGGKISTMSLPLGAVWKKNGLYSGVVSKFVTTLRQVCTAAV